MHFGLFVAISLHEIYDNNKSGNRGRRILSCYDNMKNKLVIAIAILFFPLSSICEDRLVWNASVHQSVGKLEFKYDKEKIIVFSLKLNKVI